MAAPAPAASSGFPPFDASQWPGQIVWMLVIFAVMYLLFSRVFVPRVGGAINDREDTIAANLGEARRLRDAARAEADKAAADVAAARGRAQRLAADAAAEAKAAADKSRAEEDARISAQVSAAEDRIGVARAEAMSHVRTIAVDTARAIVAKLTGEEPSADDVEQALPQSRAA